MGGGILYHANNWTQIAVQIKILVRNEVSELDKFEQRGHIAHASQLRFRPWAAWFQAFTPKEPEMLSKGIFAFKWLVAAWTVSRLFAVLCFMFHRSRASCESSIAAIDIAFPSWMAILLRMRLKLHTTCKYEAALNACRLFTIVSYSLFWQSGLLRGSVSQHARVWAHACFE